MGRAPRNRRTGQAVITSAQVVNRFQKRVEAAMTRLNVNDARCEALFASALQRSDAPTAGAVGEAIRRTVRQFGVGGCASRMAQEFGDRPDAARDRMQWVRQLLADLAVVGTSPLVSGALATHSVPRTRQMPRRRDSRPSPGGGT